MPETLPDPLFDAFVKAQARGILPTSLDTAGLRELTAQARLASAFTARGTSRIFATMIKRVIDAIVSGEIDEASAVGTLFETIQATGYTPEGGFPTMPGDAAEPVPPAVAGTIQDLSTLRRLNLIVRTQTQINVGAGQQYRFNTPDRLEAAPGVELVRVLTHIEQRDWESRWQISGGRIYPHKGSVRVVRSETGMICLKGDPVLGELGASANFPDALDIDHGPFVFNGGVGLREVKRDRCEALGVTGPNGESIDEWFASRPNVIAGKLPIPSPRLSLTEVDPEMGEAFKLETGAVEIPGKPGLVTLPRMTPAERARRALAIREAEKAGGSR
jgi:hypothetical protein